jgi:hypothetical protein
MESRLRDKIEVDAPSSAAPGGKRWRWDYLIPGAILVTLLAYIFLYPDRINHDCAQLLQEAKILTLGGLPYVDFVEVNPPLIFYIDVVPVFLANVTHRALPLAFSIWVYLLIVVSTLTTYSLLKNEAFELSELGRSFILSAMLLLSLYIYASADFGQREHLFAIVFFPWFWCRVVRYEGGKVDRVLALVVGVLGGIGACIKPHFLIIVLAVELVAILQTKGFRSLLKPETIGFGVAGYLYGAHFLFLPAVVKQALFGRWLPFMSRYYRATDIDLFSYYLHHRLMAPAAVGLLLLCIAVVIVTLRRRRWSLFVELGFAAFVASIIALWVQKKGYSYHLIPVKYSLVLVLIGLCLWWYEEVSRGEGAFRRVARWLRTVPALLVSLSLLLFSAKELIARGGYYAWYESFEPFRKAILKYTNEGDRVLFLSNLHGMYPTLVQVNRLPGSRYIGTIPSTAMYDQSLRPDPDGRFPYHQRSQMPPEEVRILEELSEDISTLKPKLIFINVSDSCVACPHGFNMGEYLAQSGILDSAMRSYTKVGMANEEAIYIRQENRTVGLLHRN